MTSKKNPSQKQKTILSYIWHYQHDYNRPPTYREIEKHIGANSTSVAKHHVGQLEKMGYLKRDENLARGLSLTDKALLLLSKLSDTIRAAMNSVQLPILGDIVAGEPVDLGNDSFDTYDEDDFIIVDADQLPVRRDRLYALRVHGRSMIDALIDDGDVVVLQQFNEIEEVRDGDMVAAWLPLKEEMTLKRIYLDGETIRLKPANPDFEPIVVPREEIEVHGKVVLVQRQV